MMIIIGKLILVVSVCLVSLRVCNALFAVMNHNSLKLDLLQVNFRHGARTPSHHEARYINVTDPSIYGSQGYYQLTNEGKNQAYKLGVLLREKYDKFLGNYQPHDLYAYTSRSDRTKMTLQLVLAGLHPPLEEDKWHPTLDWRPIPFDAAKSENDALITPHQCKKYAEIYREEIANSKEYQNEMAKYSELFDYMEKQTGIPFKTNIIYNVGFTYYAVKIHKLMNLPLPEWGYNDEVMDQIYKAFKYNLHSMSLTQKLKRINGGTMVRQVIENIETNRNAEKPKKIYLYSSHDFTVAAFEKAQNLTAFDIPPFGSAIILEKYRDNNNVEYVRFLAWDGEDDKFFSVKMDGCEEFCPYKDYLKLVENVIPTDEELAYLVSGDDYYISGNLN